MRRGPSAEVPSAHRIAPEWVADGKRHRRRSRLLWGAVAVMAVVVVGLVLYQLLVTSPSPPPMVTVTSVHWNVTQGTLPSGEGWFGPSQFNYTLANGFPKNVSPGGTLFISWGFINYDSQNHTVMTVTATLPFQVVATEPGLPAMAPAGFDDGALTVSVQVPNAPGDVSPLFLNVTIV